MDLSLSSDQASLLQAVRDIVSREAPKLEHYVHGEPAGDAEAERVFGLVASLGYLSLGHPEGLGGMGLGLVEEVLLVRELARSLLPGPYLGTIVAGHVVGEARGPAPRAPYLDGSERAGWITGHHVLGADEGGLAVHLLEDSVQVVRLVAAETVPGVDPATGARRVHESEPIAGSNEPRVTSRARLLVAAALLGVGERATADSVEYAKTREQFGRPIGANQAVKHRCADQYIQCWRAKAQLTYAALLHDEDHGDLEVQAAAACMLAVDAATFSVAANVHNHGGIGVTAEHVSGRLVKRAHVLEQMLGPSRPLHTILARV